MIALGGTCLLPRFACAQSVIKVARIAWLSGASGETQAQNIQAFREGMRALGRIDGKDFAMEFRFSQGKPELFPTFAAEAVKTNPDCVVAGGFNAIRSLMRLTKTIPIVMGNIDSDPVQEGIVASLARPGGNVTGLTGIAWELAGKRLELLREIAPKVSRVGVLFDPRSRSGYAHFEGTEAAARKLGVELQLLEITSAGAIDQAFKRALESGLEAVSVIHIGLMQNHSARVAKLALEARLPAMYSSPGFVADGGLIAYAPNIPDQYRRAAVFVDKILKGAKPGDLPVEQPTKFELVVNLRTAKAMGIAFPQTILLRAERVIQ